MLDAMTPAEFDERWARQIIDGEGMEYWRAGIVAAEVRNGIKMIAALLARTTLKESDFVEAAHFVPGAKERKARVLTAAESEQRLAAKWG